MTPVTILNEAEQELLEAVAYYEGKASGLGLDFLSETERSVQTIRHFPERWPLCKDGTRRFLTNRFPYLVVYAYVNAHVWIIAFAHCKRNPCYWSGRFVMEGE